MNLCLDQRRIPGISRFFADYLYDFPKVSAFFPFPAPFSAEHWIQAASQRRTATTPAADRGVLVTSLRRHMSRYGALPAAVQDNLERLQHPDCVAVVTGQQTGLFGGPTLTLHKALTTVLVAERLRQEKVNAVPIFWMASQDHDLQEVNHTWTLTPEAELLSFTSLAHEDEQGRPVGRLRWSGQIPSLIEEFTSASELPADTATLLRSVYTEGGTYATAFGRLLNRWFEAWGLLLLDPMEDDISALSSPFYQRAFERCHECSDALQSRNHQIEQAGYHVQVRQNSDATLLFVEDQRGIRQPLRRAGEQFQAGEQQFGGDEIRGLITTQPGRVSASALLRPLLQDYLLPTAIHVTGPAETAYLAQSACLHPIMDVHPPLILPRVSATVLDARATRLLEKYHLSVDQLWHEAAAELLAQRVIPAQIHAPVAEMRRDFQQHWQTLLEALGQFDSTLIDAAQTTASKIEHQLEQLEGRVGRSLSRRQEELQRQARHLQNSLYPHRNLQERVLSSAYMVGHWPKLLEQLHEQLRPECFDHQIVNLG